MILAEVGNDQNTLDKALVAGSCFASALAVAIKERQQQAGRKPGPKHNARRQRI